MKLLFIVCILLTSHSCYSSAGNLTMQGHADNIIQLYKKKELDKTNNDQFQAQKTSLIDAYVNSITHCYDYDSPNSSYRDKDMSNALQLHFSIKDQSFDKSSLSQIADVLTHSWKKQQAHTARIYQERQIQYNYTLLSLGIMAGCAALYTLEKTESFHAIPHKKYLALFGLYCCARLCYRFIKKNNAQVIAQKRGVKIDGDGDILIYGEGNPTIGTYKYFKSSSLNKKTPIIKFCVDSHVSQYVPLNLEQKPSSFFGTICRYLSYLVW